MNHSLIVNLLQQNYNKKLPTCLWHAKGPCIRPSIAWVELSGGYRPSLGVIIIAGSCPAVYLSGDSRLVDYFVR